MEPVSVGIHEIRSRIAEYLLDSNRPVAVTRPGATVGYFRPARGARADLERAALTEAAVRMNELVRGSCVGEAEEPHEGLRTGDQEIPGHCWGRDLWRHSGHPGMARTATSRSSIMLQAIA